MGVSAPTGKPAMEAPATQPKAPEPKAPATQLERENSPSPSSLYKESTGMSIHELEARDEFAEGERMRSLQPPAFEWAQGAGKDPDNLPASRQQAYFDGGHG